MSATIFPSAPTLEERLRAIRLRARLIQAVTLADRTSFTDHDEAELREAVYVTLLEMIDLLRPMEEHLVSELPNWRAPESADCAGAR
jgi:hypothetical protein